MDLYITTLAAGAVGMIAMAFGGGARGHGHAHVGHAHVGHAHVGHAHVGHAHVGHAHVGHAHAGHAHSAHGSSAREGGANPLLALMSPRVIFSVFVGLGAAGLLLRPMLGGGIATFGAALAIGIVFERAVITPVWNFAFRFASEPALSLESCLQSDATAVHAFDAGGNGLVAVEVDGRLVQLLGTLQESDRELHARVTAGAKLRIEAVDVDRNRCTVSLR
jgi:hypothetical protein